MTGKDNLSIYPLSIFLPNLDNPYLNKFFCFVIVYSFVQITPPALTRFHYLNK